MSEQPSFWSGSKQVTVPFSKAGREDTGAQGALTVGTRVLLSGVVYTARDAAHKRIVAALDKGLSLPFDLRGQVIY